LFFADCSPKDNQDVVFQADIYKNGAGVYADSYTQAVVAQQIDNTIKVGFQNTFKNCYTKPVITHYYNRPAYVNVGEVTVKAYLEETDIGFMIYYVVVDNSEVTEDDIQAEYKFLSDELIQEVNSNIKEGEIQNLVVVLYFVDDEMKEKWKEFYATNATTKGLISQELSKYNKINCSYKDGDMDKTYDEYREARLKGMEGK